MKGISPVIATILLLLIAIGVTGTAYVWLTSSQSSMQQSASQQMSNLVSKAGYSVSIISANCNDNKNVSNYAIENITIKIRNVGNKPIDLSKNIYLIITDPETGATELTISKNFTGNLQPDSTTDLYYEWCVWNCTNNSKTEYNEVFDQGTTTSFELSFGEGFSITGSCVPQ